jgi:hypothetical protein
MPRTFDEAFKEHRLTPAERAALVWHLAAFRARKTVEALMPETKHEFDPRDYGLRKSQG